MPALTAHIVSRSRIDGRTRDAMLALHRRYYENVDPRRFFADLDGKDWALLMLDAAGNVGGFSTARVVRLHVGGVPRRFLFSGDTVMDRSYWNTTALPAGFCHLMTRLARESAEELYWFLIAKGFRTYRYLPVYFREFFPRFDRATPPTVQRLLDAVAFSLFGERYNSGAGIIDSRGEHDRLSAEMAAVPDCRRLDPHVAFFLARNPTYARGDELACLTRVTDANFGPAVQRLLRRTSVTWSGPQ